MSVMLTTDMLVRGCVRVTERQDSDCAASCFPAAYTLYSRAVCVCVTAEGRDGEGRPVCQCSRGDA